jgi:hypothetical protein
MDKFPKLQRKLMESTLLGPARMTPFDYSDPILKFAGYIPQKEYWIEEC